MMTTRPDKLSSSTEPTAQPIELPEHASEWPEVFTLSSSSKNSESETWGIKAPSVLKHPAGRARLSAAVGGAVLGVCVAVLCFFELPPASFLGRLFDLREVQFLVPISIVAVFFCGLFLWYRRRQIVKVSVQVVGLRQDGVLIVNVPSGSEL